MTGILDARPLGLIGRFRHDWWWTFSLDRCYPDQRRHIEQHTCSPRPPMATDQIADVIEGVLTDWLDGPWDSTRLRELAESLAESWMKDRARAVAQATRATETQPTGVDQ